MCGISGIVYSDRARRVSDDVTRAMNEALIHRGPDDEGVMIDGPVALAHRRLSIFDPTPAGHQPMSNEDGTVWITFNGAIYNYIELRDELTSRGHVFRSRTDTETILHLYEECGADCVTRLNGMFAFAIWDARRRTLFAARDRFGIKPFYYTRDGERFAFASEIKALLNAGIVAAEPDREALADYVTLQLSLGRKTMFRGVEKLEPGTLLILSAEGDLAVRRYWSLDFTIDGSSTDGRYRDRLQSLLDDAVSLQVRADVSVGAHLSGGLDSSLVSCLASRHVRGPLRTFTAGFREGPAFDESPIARTVARSLDAEHAEVFPTEDEFVDRMPRIMYHLEEPMAGPGVFPQFAVSALAARSVRVVLGGQGGDELFGGYTRYLIAYLEACLKGGIDGTYDQGPYVVTFESILPNLAQLRGYEPLLRHFWSDGLFESPDRRYFRLIDRGGVARQCVDQEIAQGPEGYSVWDAYASVFHAGNCGSLINRMTHFDLQTLLPALLHVEDRSSMAVSLESRVPLLDHRIGELAASMPPSVKYSGGRAKHVLRQAARDIVPAAVWNRTDKMGFPVPLRRWTRRGAVRDFVHDILTGSRARSRGIFAVPAIDARLRDDGIPERDLWGLVSLELWMQTYIDELRPTAAHS